MLLAREIDCAIAALPPAPFRAGDRRIRRLVANARRAEEAYFRATGIFPIMHLIAIRRTVLDAHPWVAVSLFEAFETAKNNALKRALKASHSLYPIPWGQDGAMRAKALFGDDFWPYGLAASRPTIAAFLRFARAQGVSHRRLEPEELFAPQTLDMAKA